MMKKHISIGGCLLVVSTLAACSGDVKKTLGLKRDAPDEFRVISNLPLSVPPEFELTPPKPGAKRPQQEALNEQAKRALFNTGSNTGNGNISSGEFFLLQKTRANTANPKIRDILTEEERLKKVQQKKSSFLETLAKKAGLKRDKPETIVDATKEKHRIVEKQKEGETVTGEETHEISPKSKSVIEEILDF